MKLSHVMLMTCLTGAIAAVTEPFVPRHGAVWWLLLPIAVFAALLLAWPLSRLFRMSPLMVFSGPCPGCQARPPGWWAAEAESRRVVLVCGTCRERVELWLTRRPPVNAVPAAGHTFRLRWPEFLGMWCEVPRPESIEAR